jgi:hypothetical protein
MLRFNRSWPPEGWHEIMYCSDLSNRAGVCPLLPDSLMRPLAKLSSRASPLRYLISSRLTDRAMLRCPRVLPVHPSRPSCGYLRLIIIHSASSSSILLLLYHPSPLPQIHPAQRSEALFNPHSVNRPNHHHPKPRLFSAQQPSP